MNDASTSVEHWDAVYKTKRSDEVSWFQSAAKMSLALIAEAHLPLDAPILDVGAGASTLVDGLIQAGYRDVSLLDVSKEALAQTSARIGGAAKTIVADITQWTPAGQWACWHDRAVFHFLTTFERRAAYKAALERGLAKGGTAIIATFGIDGPERWSGLPVQRYSVESLAAEFDGVLALQSSTKESHQTPAGKIQSFVYARFSVVP